ncbi:MAG: LPS export ABC transporter ATP-binding protein [Desulfobulbaceae bacterium]|jgi:lipopolysaccharide export system ATP-binding protein|nr:LPS export ABC transporter ATP-binding protein [Desulfobulbaceae bacterium]MDH3866539.1 LPS export ABC transporter ATP-binding protein [Desulfobulbaceae bacterium]MDH3922242.1 LPS export ABC transporter ATP-binding protein [Desulfobulbaceae bacterium]MDH3995949.1 LPS export ABC transporter ATP-binding protein [Desulfobulbaceae bacterium]HKJ13719.1 LPS export ABC transporter ATP-binding protein [Desulfobulbales bacterium]
MALLEARELAKQYHKRRVVDGVSLQVENGSVVGLLGPNGAGKTTSFYMIAGFVRPTSGRVLLADEDITGLPIHKRAKRGISYLAQEPSVFKKLTVEENIRIVLEPLGLEKDEIDYRINSLLEDMKIQALAGNKANTLSGGERRRVEIMRALAIKPRFILLDEPFAGIDPLSVADLQQIIIELKNKGLGVLISDHNVRETLSVCDYAYIISKGKIFTSGSAAEIVKNEEARKIYLGENFAI